MKKGLYHFGRYLIMLRTMFLYREKFSVYWNETNKEIIANGISSLGIVVTISIFIGMVSTVQTAYQLEGSFFPITIIGGVVSTTALLEMAPTVTSLVLAGKIGSNIASQIGTMRITEQIDAIEVMGINAASYLILPKTIGAIISFPVLAIISAFFIHAGGIAIGIQSKIISMEDFMYGARLWYDDYYVTFMSIKATSFGFIIATLSAYQGYFVNGGAIEVGVASTRSVVYSCIFILITDYVLAEFLL